VEPSPGKLRRKIYDMKSTQDYSKATLRRSEGEAEYPTDDSINKCYDNIGLTYDFLSKEFDRNSLDDLGMEIIAWVHYGQHWPQALWRKGRKFMIVGDGFGSDPNIPSGPGPKKPIYFGNFAASLDSIAHELGHGITNATARFIYKGQSGALSESMSDVFASMVKQYTLNQSVDQADWLIGQDTFLLHQSDMGFRSLKQPGKAFIIPGPPGSNKPILEDNQVLHMNQYKVKPEYDDHGGVHMYSGIPNHAFYLAATQVGGYSWEKVGRIWYMTWTRGQLAPACTFDEFAKVTVSFALGFGDDIAEKVRGAWSKVGVHI
jgi:Zn-dependent metalloprotease